MYKTRALAINVTAMDRNTIKNDRPFTFTGNSHFTPKPLFPRTPSCLPDVIPNLKPAQGVVRLFARSVGRTGDGRAAFRVRWHAMTTSKKDDCSLFALNSFLAGKERELEEGGGILYYDIGNLQEQRHNGTFPNPGDVCYTLVRKLY